MRKVFGLIITGLMTLGAASVQASEYYVARNGQVETYPYTNGWTSAASNIQDAVNAVPAGAGSVQHFIWVGPGRYTVPTNAAAFSDANTNVVLIGDKAIILRASSSNQADTIIDGGGLYRGIRTHCNRETTNRVVVDGFTISNCYVTNSGGAGLLFDGFSHAWTGEVRNCVITGNKSEGGTGGGGGIWGKWLGGQAPRLFTFIVSDCVIRSNSATGLNGGGIFGDVVYSEGQRMLVLRCLIENNLATYDGGGLYSGKANVEQCIIRNNSAGRYGGGVFNMNGYISLTNTLICNNSAARGGAVYYDNLNELSGNEQELVNCTVVSNSAGSYGGVTLRNNATIGQVLILNSIVYSNANVDFYNVPNMTNIFLTASCTSLTNGFPGSGNITNSPKFAGFAGGNFQLTSDSPCVNRGLNQSWMNGTLDLGNHPRLDRLSWKVDIGCYEYIPRGTMFTTR